MSSLGVVFFNLPPELAKCILGQLLRIRDVVRLDSATKKSMHLNSFRNLLSNTEIGDTCGFRGPHYRRLWEWKIERGVLVRSITCRQLRVPNLSLYTTPFEAVENVLIEYIPRFAHALQDLLLVIQRFPEPMIQVIALNCKVLSKICFINCRNSLRPEVTPLPSIAPITRNCKLLKHIRINKAYDFDQEAAQTVNSDLLQLNLSGIPYSYDDLHTVIRRCPRLTELRVSGGNIVPAALPETYSLVQSHLPDIRSLSFFDNGCCLRGIEALFSCAHLQELNCCECQGLTPAMLEGLLFMPSMRNLSFTECSDFDCVIPQAFVERASQLTQLFFYDFSAISDDGLASILVRCPALQELAVFNADILTTNIVDSIVRCCKKMCKVSLANCGHAQYDSVQARVDSLSSSILFHVMK